MKHGTTKYNNLMAKEIFLSSTKDFSFGGGGDKYSDSKIIFYRA